MKLTTYATIAIIGALAALLMVRLPVLAQSDYSNPGEGAQPMQTPQVNGDDQQQMDPSDQSDDSSQASDQNQDQDSDSDADQSDSDSGDTQGGGMNPDQGGSTNPSGQ